MVSKPSQPETTNSGREALILTENGFRVLKARYLKKDEAGNVVEQPEDLFDRVASCVGNVESTHYGASPDERNEWIRRFYNLMVSGRFMPNSPTLMNAGREMGMLSACFVLPVRDSVDAIFDSIKHTALIQKAGGGTGFAFDELRPTGDYIHSSGGTTSGPISFWRAFSEATNAIQQGAFRRGANMGMMYVHHPDILKFLHAKQDLHAFSNYNISVKLTDEWMRQFHEDPDSPHLLRNPRTGLTYYLPRDVEVWEYDVRSLIPAECLPPESDRPVYVQTPRPAGPVPPDYEGKVYTKRQIWDIIVRNAWATGEPGVVFIDQVNRSNPTPNLGRIEATNPCGEQPLLPYEACNLGSINLSKFIRNPGTDKARVDWDALRETVHHAVRFLDNVIDANKYPLDQIEAMCKKNRKIGLGLMGFADALFRLSVGYNTPEGVAWAERFMKFVNDEAHNYSEQLACERGCFPNWASSIWDTVHHRPMRNASCTTVAPTGTISIIADCSGGIEPLFSLVFYRNVLRGKGESQGPLLEVNQFFRQVLESRGLYSEGLMDHIATDGTLAHIEEIPADLKRVFVCAHDISPEWHIKIQAAFQRHCDASISKTINFPKDAQVEDVDKIYRMAFELGCKGVTVYRDGCREAQPMALKNSGTGKRTAGQEPAENARTNAEATTPQKTELEPRQLPEIVSGLRIRQMTPFGNIHVKITVDPRTGQELEVFAQLGKGGDVAASDLEAICRMISLWLRAGGSLKHVIQQLKGIGSSLQIPTKDGKIMSLGDGLARALMKYQRAKEVFGLEDLLLGRADLSELANGATEFRTRQAAPPGMDPGSGGSNGGGGNGKGGNGKGDGQGRTLVQAGSGSSRPEVRLGERSTTYVELAPVSVSTTTRTAFKVKCPECGSDLTFGEGCAKCQDCGWAKC